MPMRPSTCLQVDCCHSSGAAIAMILASSSKGRALRVQSSCLQRMRYRMRFQPVQVQKCLLNQQLMNPLSTGILRK